MQDVLRRMLYAFVVAAVALLCTSCGGAGTTSTEPRGPAHGQLIIAKCKVTVEGKLTHCRVVRSSGDRKVDEEELAALSNRRVRPVQRNGVPISTDYVLNIRPRPR
ncbi:uncharacterized protein SOCE836_002460 [Sorangium cellulosum]|uniref:TonB C-terminal domain-containing protein n=2 Tax=Polyangiaceae TaxID=49 RepID=A0A4P2QFF3_SORCE|nr:uncharacterized protein SOCE836_002460 [Sorangium cellulosum]